MRVSELFGLSARVVVTRLRESCLGDRSANTVGVATVLRMGSNDVGEHVNE